MIHSSLMSISFQKKIFLSYKEDGIFRRIKCVGLYVMFFVWNVIITDMCACLLSHSHGLISLKFSGSVTFDIHISRSVSSTVKGVSAAKYLSLISFFRSCNIFFAVILENLKWKGLKYWRKVNEKRKVCICDLWEIWTNLSKRLRL